MRWPGPSPSPSARGDRPSTAQALTEPGVVAVFFAQPGRELIFQFGSKRQFDAAPKQRIFVQNLDQRQRRVVTVALAGVGIQVGENVGHAGMHDFCDALVEKLRVRGGAAIRQARDVITRLEPVGQRIVQIEDDIDPILTKFGDQVIQPVEGLGVAAEIVQTVQARDVDALAAHAAHRVIGLLLAPQTHLCAPEANRRAVLEHKLLAFGGDEPVFARWRLHPAAAVQNGFLEIVAHGLEGKPMAVFGLGGQGASGMSAGRGQHCR